MKVRELINTFRGSTKISIYDYANNTIVFHSYVDADFRYKEGINDVTPYDHYEVLAIRPIAGDYLDIEIHSNQFNKPEKAVELRQYDVNFRFDNEFVENFFALKESWEHNAPDLKDIQAKAKHHLYELNNPGCWISWYDVEWFEENFIFSDRGFHRKAEECSGIARFRSEVTKIIKGED